MPTADRKHGLPIARDASGIARRGDGEPAVVLRGVCKSYGSGNAAGRVVDCIDLTVRRGECVFLLGPSGSGKTTLLSIVGCVLGASEGEVRILGHDVGRLDAGQAADLRLRHIGFLFQRFHLIRGLTAAQNVAVPLTLSGWKPGDATRRAGELLALVDLADKANVDPPRLSMGQCQRVALARALAADPELVLADEPTASLDARTGHQAMELLHRLTVGRGKTLVVVTHDPRILEFADRTLHMENGQLQERSPSDEPMLAAALAHHAPELAAVH